MPRGPKGEKPAESKQDEWSQRREQYEIFRDYIKHEDELIHNRTTWAVTVQGFLFAAYALVLQSHADFEASLFGSLNGQFINRAQDSDALPVIAHEALQEALRVSLESSQSRDLLLWAAVVLLPLTGMLVSGLSLVSIHAARGAVLRLTEDFSVYVLDLAPEPRKPVEKALYGGRPVLPYLTGGGEEISTRRGWVLAYSIPIAFVTMWAIVAGVTWFVVGSPFQQLLDRFRGIQL